MKEISQRQPKQQLLQQHAEERSNNIISYRYWKAGVIACLFFCFARPACAEEWTFGFSAPIYRQVTSLEFSSAIKIVSSESTPGDVYIASLAEALELLVTEDKSRFELYEEHFETRLDRRLQVADEVAQFLRAEMHLQWAFVYLKFGQEFDAASHLHEAYKIANKCKKKYPKFLPIRKTTGLLEVMIGSVPEKYSWLLSVLGMRGSVNKGLEDLDLVITNGGDFSFETTIIHALVDGFILQKPHVAITNLDKTLEGNNDNRSVLMLAAVMALKNSASEQALGYLERLSQTSGLPLYYASYLKGEVLLHKGMYDESIRFYQRFLQEWKGSNYVKDANFKIGMCYHLAGLTDMQKKFFKLAVEGGTAVTEADRAAQRALADVELPNVLLSKVRYATDGGYYELANEVFSTITDSKIQSRRDQVEYYYRKARLEHKTNHLPAAKLFYRQAIDLAQDQPWYFAPNACLQMGYILQSEGSNVDAKEYFRRALSYRHHEYKNSIDAKAKSALAELEKGRR